MRLIWIRLNTPAEQSLRINSPAPSTHAGFSALGWVGTRQPLWSSLSLRSKAKHPLQRNPRDNAAKCPGQGRRCRCNDPLSHWQQMLTNVLHEWSAAVQPKAHIFQHMVSLMAPCCPNAINHINEWRRSTGWPCRKANISAADTFSLGPSGAVLWALRCSGADGGNMLHIWVSEQHFHPAGASKVPPLD